MSSTTKIPAENSNTGASSEHSPNVHQLYTDMSMANVSPLWTVLDKMVPPRPNPKAVVTSWPYDAIRPLLMESGKLISAEDAERRVLMLNNPTLGAPYTTDTLYAGLQLILPGETAPAHRHVAFALRFIVEGSRGFTAVEGQKLVMERGDVILTPSWHWHDHGSEGDGPMVWLDGLDLPVFRFLPVNFAENYAESRYPSAPAGDSNLKIPWSTVATVLDADMDRQAHARYHYTLGDGKHLSKTVSAQAERIAPGATTKPVRETVSLIYHVYEGEGYTTLVTPDSDGEQQRVQWKARDTFAIPAWSVVSHTCTSQSRHAYLFAINDRPMVERLGMYRKEEL
ncbi:RmlC-like cupin domain-containing protein [Copromyces sp. CBS 386.78]|nr:RmlC-like cupin domain-containing protein [Copromyces sp. CBS 386.78]